MQRDCSEPCEIKRLQILFSNSSNISPSTKLLGYKLCFHLQPWKVKWRITITVRPGLSWVVFIVNHDLHCCCAVDEKPWNVSVLFWSCEWLEANFPYPHWVWDVFVYLHQQLIFVRWCFKTSWGLLNRVCSWLLYQNHPTA